MALIIVPLIIILAATVVAVMKILGRWKGSPAGEGHPVLGKVVNGVFYLLLLLILMILAVTSESIKPLSLKIQLFLILLLAVIPSVFVLVISLPGIKDAFKKYEYIDDRSPVEEEVFQPE